MINIFKQTFLAFSNSHINMSKQVSKSVKIKHLKPKLRPKARLVECACGCHGKLLDRDSKGRIRKYIYGHHNHGKNHWNWKGGRMKHEDYWLILRPEHPRTDKDGYVGEHILKMEKKIGRYVKWYEVVHHKDKDPSNNRLSNLQLTIIWEHQKLHRKDCRQICTRCSSKDVVRNGFKNGKQTFLCNTCRANSTFDKIRGIDFGQICLNCNSRYVVKSGGIKNGKQRFQCRDCRKGWGIPLQDLKQIVSNNDRQYKIKSRMKIR
jgi:transposase-like protein